MVMKKKGKKIWKKVRYVFIFAAAFGRKGG